MSLRKPGAARTLSPSEVGSKVSMGSGKIYLVLTPASLRQRDTGENFSVNISPLLNIKILSIYQTWTRFYLALLKVTEQDTTTSK